MTEKSKVWLRQLLYSIPANVAVTATLVHNETWPSVKMKVSLRLLPKLKSERIAPIATVANPKQFYVTIVNRNSWLDVKVKCIFHDYNLAEFIVSVWVLTHLAKYNPATFSVSQALNPDNPIVKHVWQEHLYWFQNQRLMQPNFYSAGGYWVPYCPSQNSKVLKYMQWLKF